MLMDLGAGVLIGIVVNYFSTGEPNGYFAIFGALSALTPDIDGPIYTIKNYRGKSIDKFFCLHREIAHHPLIYLVLSIIIGLIYLPFGIIFFLGNLFHFIHDIFTAFGIPVFKPFSDWHFVINRRECPKFLIKTSEEHVAIIAKYGSDTFIADMNDSSEQKIAISIFLAGIFASAFWFWSYIEISAIWLAKFLGVCFNFISI